MPRLMMHWTHFEEVHTSLHLISRPGIGRYPWPTTTKKKLLSLHRPGFTSSTLRLSDFPTHQQRLERMMDTVHRGLRWKMCLCYLDDIVVYSATFSAHIRRLHVVLSCLSTAGLQLNRKKCHFAYTQRKVLGHVVFASGVSPDPDKIKAV